MRASPSRHRAVTTGSSDLIRTASRSVAAAPWPAPKDPIDLRDIVKSPTAPGFGYREYLPGYWIPDRALNGPR